MVVVVIMIEKVNVVMVVVIEVVTVILSMKYSGIKIQLFPPKK